jgi:hypothetical protein
MSLDYLSVHEVSLVRISSHFGRITTMLLKADMIDTDSCSRQWNPPWAAVLQYQHRPSLLCVCPNKDLCKAATWNYVREYQWRSVPVLGDMNIFLFWFLFCWWISCKLLSDNKIWYSLSRKPLCYLGPPDVCINPLFT